MGVSTTDPLQPTSNRANVAAPQTAHPMPSDDELEQTRRQIAAHAAKIQSDSIDVFGVREYEELNAQYAKAITEQKAAANKAREEFDKLNTWYPSGWVAQWTGTLAGARARLTAEDKLVEDLASKQQGLKREFEEAQKIAKQHVDGALVDLTEAGKLQGAEKRQCLENALDKIDLATGALTIKGVDRTSYEAAKKRAKELSDGKAGLMANLEIGGSELRSFAIWGTAAIVTAAIALPLMAPMAAGVGLMGLIGYGILIPAFAGLVGTAAGTAVGAVTSGLVELNNFASGNQTKEQCFQNFKSQVAKDFRTASSGAKTAATIISAGKIFRSAMGIANLSASGAASAVLPSSAASAAQGTAASGALPWVSASLRAGGQTIVNGFMHVCNLGRGVLAGTTASVGSGTAIGAVTNGTDEGIRYASGEKSGWKALGDFTSRTQVDAAKSMQTGFSTTMALTLPAAGGSLMGNLAKLPVVGRIFALPPVRAVTYTAGYSAGGGAASGLDTALEYYGTGAANPVMDALHIPGQNGEIYWANRQIAETPGYMDLTTKQKNILEHQTWREHGVIGCQFRERFWSNVLTGALLAPISRFLPQGEVNGVKQFVAQQVKPQTIVVRAAEAVVAHETSVDRLYRTPEDEKKSFQQVAIAEFAADVFAGTARRAK